MRKKLISYLAFLALPLFLFANSKTPTIDSVQIEDLINQLDTLPYIKEGKMSLGDKATFTIPSGFKFLKSESAEYVLSDVWGNPQAKSLGLIVPKDQSVYYGAWAVDVYYEDEGHIKDDDAKDIDYSDLLKTMQDESVEANKERKKMGYPTVEILGWANKPYYDEKEKKLFWAKRVKFEGDTFETLNYNFRILGRNGVLVLNAIGDMSQLEEIKAATPSILNAVNFTPGNSYADFDEKIDKVAAYGIGGLIAGGILAKTGLLAKVGLIFAKFAKVIIVGIGAIFAGVMKYFKRDKNNTEENA